MRLRKTQTTLQLPMFFLFSFLRLCQTSPECRGIRSKKLFYRLSNSQCNSVVLGKNPPVIPPPDPKPNPIPNLTLPLPLTLTGGFFPGNFFLTPIQLFVPIKRNFLGLFFFRTSLGGIGIPEIQNK